MEFIIEYWIEFLFTFLCTGILYMLKQYMGLKHGMISLLSSEILKVSEKCFEVGYCPSYTKENVQNMYDSYHKLGGNGMVTIVVNNLYKLPSFKCKKEDAYNEKN